MNELQGAYRSHARAREHLTNLEGVVGRIQDLGKNGVLAQENPETQTIGPSQAILDPLRLDAGVLVGEVVHNLRAALDYLVYVLAAHDAGTPQSGTQFLIEDHPQGFTARSARYLKGITDEHVAIIRQFQPFKGAKWSGLLRDFDNASKHREILSVNVDLSVASILHLTEFHVGVNYDAEHQPAPEDMSMYLKGPVEILLPEGRPLIQTLREIETQVGLVLFLFSNEFPGG